MKNNSKTKISYVTPDGAKETTLGEYLREKMIKVTHPDGVRSVYGIVTIDVMSNNYEDVCEELGINLYDEYGCDLPGANDHVIYQVVRYRSGVRGHEVLLSTTLENEVDIFYCELAVDNALDNHACDFSYVDVI